jgi:4-hydroxy-tetrahydrodipicolinate synthase
MRAQDLYGFVPAVVTPFDEMGRVCEDDFGAMIEWLIGLGASSICIAGDNGESWALSAAERGLLVRLAVNAAKGRVHIIAGCSAPTLATALDYARVGRDNGAQALLMMPPTYVLKGSSDEIVRRFAAVGKDAGLPIIAYNSPRRAGYSIGLDVLETLLNTADIIGIKESDRDFFRHTHLIGQFASRMSIMTGPSHYILPALALGAAGFIATGPEFLGTDAGKLCELARQPWGDRQRALHHRLTTIYETLMELGTWPAAFKAGLTLIGQPAGVPRDPVLPLGGPSLERLRAVLGPNGA